MKRGIIVLVTALIMATLGCATDYFIHMSREVTYGSMYDPQCVFYENKKSLRLSFVFINSFLSITDYRLIQKEEGDRVRFFITLIGRNLSEPERIIVNKDIQIRNGRTEVVIPESAYNPLKDEFYYKNGRRIHRLQVIVKAE